MELYHLKIYIDDLLHRAVAPKPSEEVLLLTEIRDLLKKETKTAKNSKTKKS